MLRSHPSRMARWRGRTRRAAAAVAAAVLLPLLAVTPAAADGPALHPAAPTNSIQAVSHQMPFPCGQTWSGQTRTNHSPQRAIDLNRANDHGDIVVASAAGTVVHRGTMAGTGYGRLIVIRHADGTASYYAHLSVYLVNKGQQVSQGQQIGRVGNSGNSSGSHLHYEQRTAYGGSAVPIVWNGSRVLYYGTRNYTSNNCGGSSNPYTPTQVCGSGYKVINSHALGNAGRVYLLYNSNNGYNCVVTMKTRNVGTPTATTAFLEPQGSNRTTDSGNFSYYAGPVKRYAAGTCVRWGGSTGGQSYTSPFQHCGA